MKDLLSIVLVTNNEVNKIYNCLESIVRQKYANYEVIIIVNGSNISDNDEIINQFKKVKIIKNKTNLGTSIARNQGLKLANGDYIVYIDDDAVLLSDDIFDKVVSTMSNNPNVGQLGGIHYADMYKQKRVFTQVIMGPDGFLDREKSNLTIKGLHINNEMIIPTCFCVIRTDIIKKIGGFDPFLFFLEEDNDVSMRIRKYGYDIAVNSDISFFHITGSSPRNLFERYRAKNYLIVKSYGLHFKIKYFYTLINNLFNVNSRAQFKAAFVKILFFIYFLFLYPLIYIRRNLNYLQDKSFTDYFSHKILNILFELINSDSRNEKYIYIQYMIENNTPSNNLTKKEIKLLFKNINYSIKELEFLGDDSFNQSDLVSVIKGIINNTTVYNIDFHSEGRNTALINERIQSILKFVSINTRINFNLHFNSIETSDYKGNNSSIDTLYRLLELSKNYFNLFVNVVTTVSLDNIHQLKDLNNWLENELNVKHYFYIYEDSLISVKNENRGIVKKSLDKDQINDYFTTHNEIYKHIINESEHLAVRDGLIWLMNHQRNFMTNSKSKFECNAPYKNLTLYSDGRFSFCENIKPIGTVRDFNFKFNKFWHSNDALHRRSELKYCSCNHPINIKLNYL